MNKFEQLYLDLQAKLYALECRILQLELENNALKKENAQLKEKLGLNSKNSSIPTSKEIYKLKKTNKPNSECKQGAQAGHKGYSRDKMVADEIVKIDLDSMVCECGGNIGIIAPYIHQKIDIPEIKPHVTNYYIERGRCNTNHLK